MTEQNQFFFQAKDIDTLLEWLCTTPKTTCIRVNLLRTTTDKIKSLLLDELVKNHPTYEIPKIIINDDFPEVILVGNINGDNDLRSETERKEVVVDVNCAASILRGTENLFTYTRRI